MSVKGSRNSPSVEDIACKASAWVPNGPSSLILELRWKQSIKLVLTISLSTNEGRRLISSWPITWDSPESKGKSAATCWEKGWGRSGLDGEMSQSEGGKGIVGIKGPLRRLHAKEKWVAGRWEELQREAICTQVWQLHGSAQGARCSWKCIRCETASLLCFSPFCTSWGCVRAAGAYPYIVGSICGIFWAWNHTTRLTKATPVGEDKRGVGVGQDSVPSFTHLGHQNLDSHGQEGLSPENSTGTVV